MPWSRLRTARSGDTTGALRRHSTIDPLPFQSHDEHNPNRNPLRLGHDAPESVKTPSPLRNSFEPSAVDQATSSAEIAQSPMLRDQPPKRQRFSLLKYRHASDPQVDLPLLLKIAARDGLTEVLFLRFRRQPRIMNSCLYRLCQLVSSLNWRTALVQDQKWY